MFLRLCIVKKLDSIRTKLTDDIDFEVCPYGDSSNGTAAAARRSVGYLMNRRRGGMQRSKLGGHSKLGAFGTGSAIGL